MNIVAIVQARMGSTRYPNKVMLPVCRTPLIGLLLKRLAKSKLVTKIVLATTDNSQCNPLAEYVSDLGYEVYRGDEIDVLDRYFKIARQCKADIITRITGDCPLIDAVLVDEIIREYMTNDVDYVSNISPPTYPDGLDTEVFSMDALSNTWENATKPSEREHVTPYIRNSIKFEKINYTSKSDESAMRWTVDEPDDLAVVENIFSHFNPQTDFSWLEVLNLNKSHPEYFAANRHLARNTGASMSTGQKLWKRAKRVIPGGNMLLSKRVEMFLPDQWPAYFSKAKGCKVWDLDGKEYIDMSIMGIGTNILGYGHPEVDAAVQQTVMAGNMSTFNCPEEVYLAERLIELHPWAQMARLARTGGEANAIAIRIARAFTGKDTIAICGYHGWHDWYLAANLGNKDSLTGHLLSGLKPAGVPENLKGSVLPFHYNNIDELEELIHQNRIGAIKMEVSRNFAPKNDFLRKVRKLADDNGIVLIFDECTSGFRETMGGIHKKFDVNPDLAVFGKALGNGYAITAVIGKREIMQVAQDTFISSTFWTERIGPTAALKTLDIMQQLKSWEYITRLGTLVEDLWKELANKSELPIEISGLPSLTGFKFPLTNGLKYKTLITQEMLKKGFLASTSVYTCIEHNNEILDQYRNAMEPIFDIIKECEEGRSIDTLLQGPVCHSGFERLN